MAPGRVPAPWTTTLSATRAVARAVIHAYLASPSRRGRCASLLSTALSCVRASLLAARGVRRCPRAFPRLPVATTRPSPGPDGKRPGASLSGRSRSSPPTAADCRPSSQRPLGRRSRPPPLAGPTERPAGSPDRTLCRAYRGPSPPREWPSWGPSWRSRAAGAALIGAAEREAARAEAPRDARAARAGGLQGRRGPGRCRRRGGCRSRRRRCRRPCVGRRSRHARRTPELIHQQRRALADVDAYLRALRGSFTFVIP
jgi:hypothetical protein